MQKLSQDDAQDDDNADAAERSSKAGGYLGGYVVERHLRAEPHDDGTQQQSEKGMYLESHNGDQHEENRDGKSSQQPT